MVTRKWLTFLGLSVLLLTACHITTRPPTLQPTVTSPATHLPTPLLPTPTISPLTVLTNYLENPRVVKVDTFDDPSGWNPPDEISNGQLILTGLGGSNWHGLSNRAIFREGSGAMINFQFTPGESFEMYFERGRWTTSLYKRFGIYVNTDHSNVNIFVGKSRREPALIAGNLSLSPGTWYSVLLVVGKGGDFSAVLWDPANPQNRLQYREVIANWGEAEWAFRIQVNTGIITFDDFEEIEFDAIR